MSKFKFIGVGLLTASSAYSDFGKCGSINGIELPCWTDFKESSEGEESLPYYPYAKRENGCSIPFFTPGEHDNFLSFGFNFSFRDACNQHDRCYYRPGTSASDCNTSFLANLNEACAKGVFQDPKWYDLLGLRVPAVAACFVRAESMASTVSATQSIHHTAAQGSQSRYFDKVQLYIEENYDGAFPVAKNRLWTGTQGIADRWDFAKLFEKGREVYVTHRNNGTFYASQLNLDGTHQNYIWAGAHGIADRWAFAEVFGNGRDQYVTHRNNGTFFVTQLNRDNSKQMWMFTGHGIADRWTFADVFGTGREQYVTHRNNGTFYVTQMNDDNSVKNWTLTSGHGIADRWDFAKVFGYGTDIYVTHRNNGEFYTTRLNRDGTTSNKVHKGAGIADRWAFADIFGTGREVYVTHRNNGQFYATQLNEDGTATNWIWDGGQGIGDRWAFTDFFGTGREVFVTHKNSGIFYITQLNEDGSLSNLVLHGGQGIADRFKFANIFGKKATAYVTHRNNGTVYSTEINNGVVISEFSLSGGVLTYAFDVPSDGDDVKIEMAGGTGDADLYVRKGSAPTLDSFDCRPYIGGNTETCTYPGPAGGRYYIMIYPYSSYSGVSLQARYKP